METSLSGIVETTILQFESYEVMSDSCVLAVDQRQWPMGDPEYGDKLLTDGSGGPYQMPAWLYGQIGKKQGLASWVSPPQRVEVLLTIPS